MSRFVWTALALVVFVAPASAQLLRRGHNNCNSGCNSCGTQGVSQCGYSACGSNCGSGCNTCATNNCCNQGGVVRTGFLHRGNNNCCNNVSNCGYSSPCATCGGCSGCGGGMVAPATAPAARPMPTGAMMTPMQPIIQASATMAPPVAGTKNEGTTPVATTPVTTTAPVMMASTNNCCCQQQQYTSNGGMFRRGLLRR